MLVMFVGGVVQQPGGQQDRDGHGDQAEHQQLQGQRDAGRDGDHADARADQRTDTPAAVQFAHDRAAELAFDVDGLGVHGDVEAAREQAPHGQRAEQFRQRAGQADQDAGQAVADRGDPHHPTAAEAGQDEPDQQGRGDRTDRLAEQAEAELTVVDVQGRLDLRHVRGPGGEQDAVDDEHHVHREPGPTSPRVHCGLVRRGQYRFRLSHT
jgi:hypothetical protein